MRQRHQATQDQLIDLRVKVISDPSRYTNGRHIGSEGTIVRTWTGLAHNGSSILLLWVEPQGWWYLPAHLMPLGQTTHPAFHDHAGLSSRVSQLMDGARPL